MKHVFYLELPKIQGPYCRHRIYGNLKIIHAWRCTSEFQAPGIGSYQFSAFGRKKKYYRNQGSAPFRPNSRGTGDPPKTIFLKFGWVPGFHTCRPLIEVIYIQWGGLLGNFKNRKFYRIRHLLQKRVPEWLILYKISHLYYAFRFWKKIRKQ